MMAEMKKLRPPARVVQNPYETQFEDGEIEPDDPVQTVKVAGAWQSVKYNALSDSNETQALADDRTTPTSHAAPLQRGAALPTREFQVQKRDERRKKKDTARQGLKLDGRMSGASGPATPLAESSASGSLREAMTAGVATTHADASASQPFPSAVAYRFPTRPAMPPWYVSISAKTLAQLDRRRPQELAAIDALKNCITRCEHEKDNTKLKKLHNELRHHVHKAEIKLDMNRIKVKKTRILTDHGLPRIFREDAEFPWDLKAEAWYLYERWMNEDFQQDILRGIVTVKGKDRNGDRIDHAYREKHPRDPKFFGEGGLVLGQWWPSQLCTVRDGAHGAAQGG